MKKKIAYWLVGIARLLYPIHINVFSHKNVYKPMVCGRAYRVNKNIIRRYNQDHGLKSMREAKRKVVCTTLVEAKSDVLKAIESDVMEQRVYEKEGETIIEVRVNCYVKQKEY